MYVSCTARRLYLTHLVLAIEPLVPVGSFAGNNFKANYQTSSIMYVSSPGGRRTRFVSVRAVHAEARENVQGQCRNLFFLLPCAAYLNQSSIGVSQVTSMSA